MSGMVSKETSKITFTWLVLLSIALTYIVFAPTINIPFFHHDLYKFSTGGGGKPCDQMCGYGSLLSIGRPISAWLDCSNFLFAYTLEYITYSRLICVFLIGLAMGAVAHYLYLRLASFWLAFFISGCLFFLPCIQTTMIMAANNLILSIMLAFLANLLVMKGLQTSPLFIKTTLFILGICSLLSSFFTYPALSGFFLIPTFITLLWSPYTDWKNIRPSTLLIIFLFGICSGAYYLAAKHIQLQFAQEHHISTILGSYQIKVNLNITARIFKLFTLLPQLWNVYYGFWQSFFVYLILSAGILIKTIKFFTFDVIKQHRNMAFVNSSQIILTALIMIISGASFYLVQPEDVAFGRLIFVFQAFAVLILAWALLQIATIFRGSSKHAALVFIGGMFFVSAIQANYTITKSALNDNIEFTYLTSVIANKLSTDKQKIERIHIITPPYLRHNSFVGLPQKDDIFTGISSDNAGDILNMLNTALQRLGVRESYKFHDCLFSDTLTNKEKQIAEAKCISSGPKGSLIVTSSHENVSLTPQSLIINMGNLYEIHYKP